MFNVTPKAKASISEDDELRIIDATLLGLVPTILNKTITYLCNKFDGNCTHKPTHTSQTLALTSMDKEIIALLLGRAVG